jgi:threonine dehydrogenase-like Zn-dependent dehydrogenase
MKVKAAIAMEAAKPLIIDEIDLEGPKAGEVLVRLSATGVCHTDAETTSFRSTRRNAGSASSASRARRTSVVLCARSRARV